ncbi:nickel ABC transporter permease [Caldalkalibacillus mannanilyticus]|uniref:nickel ABC transporter permease n=1 Tax=Caldalkalibacillus mannanilyticus TaxID=1418 RepID=UPI00046872D0|nr:nickel ABC transporter permease [Caldalkalibacillus mannanilyticus]
MKKMILSRLWQLMIVLFILSLATFILMKLAPGDPVRTILKTDEVAVTVTEEEALRAELGFDQPLLIQYGQWLFRLIQLDLGHSYISQKPVIKEIGSRFLPTLYLTLGGLAVMLFLSFILGTLAAIYHQRLIDHVSRIIAFLGASVPTFWLGLLLIYWFSYKLDLLPSFGSGSVQHLILPSLTLGLGMSAVYARLLRAGLLESFTQEYIRAARARGLGEVSILFRHSLRAALLPVMTMFGMSFGALLGGSVVVENLFSWPGLGKMVVEAILRRDYPVIQGYILFTGALVVIVNLVVDLSYRFLDPRIRLGGEESR